MRHFEKAKNPAGCRTTAEMWENLKRTDPDSIYMAACMRAVTAAVLRAEDSPEAVKPAAGEADRAMAWLKQSVAAGFKNVEFTPYAREGAVPCRVFLLTGAKK